ncbi:MAG: nuclear transport factor 2 family protein [Mesorhizobium sp.]|nr:nuclear transport factor 2 family protein [Mesorhizobium sp.]
MMGASDARRDAVEATVSDYVEGMVFADEAKLRRAFHPAGVVVGHYEDTLEWLSLEDFIASCAAAGPAPLGTKASFDILTLDMTGDVATVKVTDEYLGARFTDYLTLLEHDGRWQIVNKTYFHHG